MGTISVSHLGKAYKQYPTRWSRLREWLTPGSREYHQLKWVLQDVNFTVQPGEAVGIIGINGAGKSTLLKLITGTTQPTTGSVAMTGRVAAMLELGMGFHTDFTGRQNVLMAGQLLGLGAEEVNRLMPEIEAFAEVGDYIDQPVRVYSSGMQMRLAFSVATAVRPDVLIVDEALSVGDAYFQHKSFDRIREFRKQGTTLLIVSHDKQAIQSICDRALLLSAGRLVMEGQPEVVMDFYNAMLADKEGSDIKQIESRGGKVQTVSGSGEVAISSVKILNADGNQVEFFRVGESVKLVIEVTANSALDELVAGFVIKDRLGQEVFGTNSYHLDMLQKSISAGSKLTYSYAFSMNLGEGTYSVSIALHKGNTHIHKNYEWRDLALVFNVVNVDKESFVGTAWLETELEVSNG